MGKTIMVSSHILPELADVCNKIGMIEKGVLKVSGTVPHIMSLVRPRTVLQVGVQGDLEVAGKVLEQSELLEKIEVRSGHLLVTLQEGVTDYSDLPTLLIQAGHKLTMFKEDEINLETAFMALTRGITA